MTVERRWREALAETERDPHGVDWYELLEIVEGLGISEEPESGGISGYVERYHPVVGETDVVYFPKQTSLPARQVVGICRNIRRILKRAGEEL